MCCSRGQRGFTLLEMIVVLMIVGMISALLMQGFMYMAGIYHVVERRQQAYADDELLRGWIGDSVRGLLNGIDTARDDDIYASQPFVGDTTGFSGLGLQALSNAGGVARPLRVEWALEPTDAGGIVLVYRELRSASEVPDEFRVRTWPRASGRFSYLSDGQWLPSFPQIDGMAWDDPGQLLLPDAIRLEIDSPRAPLALILRPATGRMLYQPPSRAGEE